MVIFSSPFVILSKRGLSSRFVLSLFLRPLFGKIECSPIQYYPDRSNFPSYQKTYPGPTLSRYQLNKNKIKIPKYDDNLTIFIVET